MEIFERLDILLGIDIPNNDLMNNHMDKWLNFILGEAPYLYGKNRKNKMKSVQMAALIIREYAKISLIEYETTITGQNTVKATWLQYIHDSLIKPLIKPSLQWALGLGNVIYKPKYRNGQLKLEYVTYPNFVPVQWTDGELTSVIFITTLTRGENVYTLAELMEYENNIFSIENYSFKRKDTQQGIGSPVELGEVPEWANLENFSVDQVTQPWFILMKTPQLNTADPNSPLGVSVLINTADSIEMLDETYSALRWEVLASRNRTGLPKSMFSSAQDSTGKRIPINPDPEDTYFMMTEADPLGGDKPYQFAPPIREVSHINIIKFHLETIETQLSFSKGTLSADEVNGLVTATQVLAGKIETANTVSEVTDNMLKPTIKRIISVCSEMADRLRIPLTTPNADEFDVSVEINKSANVDPNIQFEQAMELYQNSLLPRHYPVLYSQIGVTEEEAIKLAGEAPEIDEPIIDGRSV